MPDIDDPQNCLGPGRCIDSDHPDVVARALALTDGLSSDLDKAIALYYWARDSIRYNPYAVGRTPADFSASATLAAGEGWCVPKAALLAALCRAVGIPARVGYADVRNHLSTANLRASMQTDVFYFHGYTSIYLNGQWVKATPAFNVELCDKFGLLPLEFDGLQDSLYHAFDRAGNRHMEYLNERGDYLDVPFEEIMSLFAVHYPNLLTDSSGTTAAVPDAADWDDDVAREVAGS